MGSVCFDDTSVATQVNKTISFDVVPGTTVRILASANGTTASDTFTISNSFYQLYTNG